MAKRILTKGNLKEMEGNPENIVLEEQTLLTEMPYERYDYFYSVDKNARNAYFHFAKLFLYKNTTNEADKWINDIINNFTLPMLTATVLVSQIARAKLLYKGYIVNLFGKDFEDYDYQMEYFCDYAIGDMEEIAKQKGLPIPCHDDIKQSMNEGKNIVMAYAKTVCNMVTGVKQQEANAILQSTIRNEINNTFGLDV